MGLSWVRSVCAQKMRVFIFAPGNLGNGDHALSLWSLANFSLSPVTANASTHICIIPGFGCHKQGIAVGTKGIGTFGTAASWRGNFRLVVFTWGGRK